MTADSTTPALWTRRVRVLRLTRPRFSTRIDLRVLAVTMTVIAVALAVAWISLTTGVSDLTVADVVQALRGSADDATTRIVMDWRLPRVIFGLAGGAALAVSGAVFQSLTRNPLGSPDVIGFSAGAYSGSLLVGLAGLGGTVGTPLGALTGGLLTGLTVYALAWRRGVTGTRIIIVGIGVSFFLMSFNTYLLTTMRREDAMAAASWGAGTLSGISWHHTLGLLAVLVMALPYVAARSRTMTMLEMGDDAASSLGIAAERLRLTMLVTAVALVAIVTAAAGPIAFVALAAPQLARRMTGASSVQIVPAAALGALVLVTSDLAARTMLSPAQLPVGVLTLCIGGAYLVWLLATSGRRRRTDA